MADDSHFVLILISQLRLLLVLTSILIDCSRSTASAIVIRIALNHGAGLALGLITSLKASGGLADQSLIVPLYSVSPSMRARMRAPIGRPPQSSAPQPAPRDTF